MTLYEFNALNEDDKANKTWEGALISDREDFDHRILLYQVDAFYVEVYFNKKLNAIKNSDPFPHLNFYFFI
jgi:hypothetical protein